MSVEALSLFPRTNVATNFRGNPGYEPMGVGLHERFLEAGHEHVCATIAMLCLQPYPESVLPDTQALAILSLYAAGAASKLDKKQFRELERRVKRFIAKVGSYSYFSSSRFPNVSLYYLERARNQQMARHVLKIAVSRAKKEGILGNRNSTTDGVAECNLNDAGQFCLFLSELTQFYAGGLELIDVKPTQEFSDADTAQVCATIAMMSLAPNPKLVHTDMQSLALLSLYSAQTAVTLTTRQFRLLQRRVKRFIANSGKYTRLPNTKPYNLALVPDPGLAKYVLGLAVARAQRERII